jgi:Flp pilus assembly protein TadG
MKTKMTIKNQKGAAAVEFAIIAPLLFVFLFGIVEFGLLLYNKAVITNACREAARDAIVLRNPRLDTAGRDTLIQNTVTIYITNRLISFGQSNIPATPGGWTRVNVPPIYDFDHSITGIDNIGDAGESLTVQVRYYYQFLLLPNLMQLVKGNLTNTVTLNAVTIMRFE